MSVFFLSTSVSRGAVLNYLHCIDAATRGKQSMLCLKYECYTRNSNRVQTTLRGMK